MWKKETILQVEVIINVLRRSIVNRPGGPSYLHYPVGFEMANHRIVSIDPGRVPSPEVGTDRPDRENRTASNCNTSPSGLSEVRILAASIS